MAIYFNTVDPAGLLKEFDARIAQRAAKDGVDTWEKTKDQRYTHLAPQWKDKAYFRADVDTENKRLLFRISGPDGKLPPELEYSYYHGHLMQTFLKHFSHRFTRGVCSAKPLKAARPKA